MHVLTITKISTNYLTVLETVEPQKRTRLERHFSYCSELSCPPNGDS